MDEDSAPYAVAGQNVTLYLTGVDLIHLSIGTVLCPPPAPVPLVSKFVLQILVFDISTPIIAGTAVELFHHSTNVPATVSRLVALLEKGTATPASSKRAPRVLQKASTAVVEITLRAPGGAATTTPGSKGPTIPIETAKDNKEMGRVLLRRAGETIAAGVVIELLG